MLLGRKAMTNLDSILISRTFCQQRSIYSKLWFFLVVMYGCDTWSIKGWVVENWCFWIVLEKTLESPLDSKEIKPVNPKGNKPWITTGRTDAEAEAPIFWPPDMKSQLIGKDPDAGKVWGQEEKEATEDEIVGWHHWLNGHEQIPWCCKELDMT